MDPADFHKQNGEHKTWTGHDQFDLSKALVSGKLKNLKSEVKVHVVNLILRNYGADGYAPLAERGKDSPRRCKRLNFAMVKAFYDNLPSQNKGKYLEERNIPHAFTRDGDISKNESRVSRLIFSLL